MTDQGKVAVLIHQRIAQLAKELGHDAGGLSHDDCIPETGLLDSASLMMLIVWYEAEFGVSTDEEELTVDNFGTINLMVDYLSRRPKTAR